MPNITKAIVQRAAFPARGQTFIRDTSIQGFALRLTAKGAKSFVWEGRIKGRPRLITIGQFRTFRSPRRERAPHTRFAPP